MGVAKWRTWVAMALAWTGLAGCGDEEATAPPTGLRTLDQGLLLHWTFEDRSGAQILDLSGHGRHGTVVGGGTFVAAAAGEAVRLDGVDDSISFAGPRAVSLYGGADGAVTVSARVRVHDAAKYNALCVGCGPLHSLFVGTPGSGRRVQGAVRDTATGGLAWHQSTDSLEDDGWVEVTAIIEGGVGTRLYLDCGLDTEVVDPDIALDDFGYSVVGQGAQPDRWFAGDIDEFRIWDRALVDDEIDALCPVEPSDDGLELHWTFEDRTATEVLDISGHERHGALRGSPSFVEGPVGDAIAFDGLDDYISFLGPRDPAIYGGDGGAFTLSARVRLGDVEKYNTLCFGCGPFRSMFVGTAPYGARAMATLFDRQTMGSVWPWSTPSLVADAWTEVTMVVEGGVGTRMYLDCELDSNVVDTDVGLRDYGYSSVGQGGATGQWFDGELDELRVWSRALSDEEVAAMCPEDPPDPLAQGLELHWSFEDRVGDTVFDLSGHERNGTMVGGGFVPSPNGEAASLDGIDDRIAFVGPRDVELYGGSMGDYTMSAQVRVWDLQRYNALCFGCGPVGYLFLGNDGGIYDLGNVAEASLHTGGGGYGTLPETSRVLDEGLWFEVTLVVEGGVGGWIYVNGQLMGELLDPNVQLVDPGFSAVGQSTVASRWFGGEIDELRIWSRALSPEEIAPLGDGMPFLRFGLLMEWDFEYHIGDLVLDRSDNGRHGRLEGPVLVASPEGEAARFDGVNDFMSFAGPRDPELFGGVDGSFSVSTRLRVTDADRVNTACFGCGPFNSLSVGNLGVSGRAWARLFDEASAAFLWPTTTPAIVDDTWVEVTLTVDATRHARFYLDCQLEGELLEPDLGLHDYGYSSFGEGVGDTWLQGDVESFRVWNRELTEVEIAALCR